MAEPMTAGKLVQILRAEGLTVHEYRDWRTHNRDHKGAWGPINGVMIHHTATRADSDTVGLCYRGYTGLPGPLCHGVITKGGAVYLVGNGRANHAGLGDDNVLQAVIGERSDLPAPNERNTDGNARFYGFECVNEGDGEDPWPAAQLDAIERAAAAICRYYGWSAESVIGHKEWSYTKVDPRGFSMEGMRRRINERLARPAGREEEPVSYDSVWREDGKMRSPWGEEGNETWMAESVLERTAQGVKNLEEKVERLEVGGVDLDVLAAKVADLLAERLSQ